MRANFRLSAVRRFLFLIVLLAVCSPPLLMADDLEQKDSVGDWVIFCLKDRSALQDCSIVTAVEAESDSKIWLKLGFAYSSPSEVKMTIRTPRLTYLKKGISISGDGRQIGRAFIEICDETSCQATVSVEPPLLATLQKAEKVTFQYQIAETDSVALSINFSQFKRAIAKLSDITDLSMAAVVPTRETVPSRETGTNATFRVEIRSTSDALASRGEPVRGCPVPATKEVKVSTDLKIENLRSFNEWLISSLRHCNNNSVYWVTNEPHKITDLRKITTSNPEKAVKDKTDKFGLVMLKNYEMAKDVVFKTVREKVPPLRVVTTDLSGQMPINSFDYTNR